MAPYINNRADKSNSGFFGKGDMQAEFEEASFALNPGEVSSVVQSASGLHIIERYVKMDMRLLSRAIQWVGWHSPRYFVPQADTSARDAVLPVVESIVR